MDEQMSVVFKGPALELIKNAAKICGLPTERAGDVLIKGVKIIELSAGGKILIDRERDQLTLDLKRL